MTPEITAVGGRIIHNSRGSQTVEVDVSVDGVHTGRAAAPSGASVGRHEAVSFRREVRGGAWIYWRTTPPGSREWTPGTGRPSTIY